MHTGIGDIGASKLCLGNEQESGTATVSHKDMGVVESLDRGSDNSIQDT